MYPTTNYHHTPRMPSLQLLIKSHSLMLAVLLSHSAVMAKEKTLASFESAESLKSWTSVNDGVMGGVSKGGFKYTGQGTMAFTGELSLENNGGFSSIRNKLASLDLTGTTGIVVKSRGDGRTYWVELRVAGQMGATSYRANLPTTAGEWREIRVPYKDFRLQAFGRELPIKPVDPAAVASMGFTLADKKAGPFNLEVEYVKATSASDAAVSTAAPGGNTLVDVAAAAGGFKTLLAAAKAADLAGVLSSEGPFTLLAPTDDAFAKLPEGTLDTLLKPENRSQLVEILKNHVIPGKVTLAKALEAREGTNLLEAKIAFAFTDGRVGVGTASLLKADIEASNGIIHVIDQVLIPARAESGPLTAVGLIELAISRGVQLFNDGDTAACVAVYEVTVEALRSMDSVSEASRATLAKALKDSRATKLSREQAWILRGSMDAVWKILKDAKTAP